MGAERLLEYSRRGNLPMSRGADGVPVFDEDVVACLFPSRHASAPQTGASLGVLGSSRLGAATASEPSEREARRLEIWRKRRDSATQSLERLPRRVG